MQPHRYLTVKDFILEGASERANGQKYTTGITDDEYTSYLSARLPSEHLEICLENCLNGYDIGIYDFEQNLLIAKECTNMQVTRDNRTYVYLKAIQIANKLLKQYREKRDKITGNKDNVTL